MGPTWVLSASDGPLLGSLHLAIKGCSHDSVIFKDCFLVIYSSIEKKCFDKSLLVQPWIHKLNFFVSLYHAWIFKWCFIQFIVCIFKFAKLKANDIFFSLRTHGYLIWYLTRNNTEEYSPLHQLKCLTSRQLEHIFNIFAILRNKISIQVA